MKKFLLIFFLGIFVSFSGENEIIKYMMSQNRKLKKENAEYIYNTVIHYSNRYEVDPVLVFSVMKTESHFDHSTVSSAGARGLLQLMPFNFKEFGVDNSIQGNIKGGVMHLKRDYDRTGDIVKTLVCYNAGCGRLKNNEWRKIKETTDYITKINRVYPEIKQLFHAGNKSKKSATMLKNFDLETAEDSGQTRELTKQEKFQQNRIAFKRSIENAGEVKNEKN